ncbi:alpha/beta fold hydrolase [Jannaschia pohangensis]|uniref:Pimeloyl-ACP methyl ester carboxylesterase n=1 Tax=Jannaschia pohangensis TaxID=390807 RepID=A0A1I3UM07_9RHOB|nr:alpha/beta hydrolase [Jannaschia pohangensis]SFJ82777.1 Pimeloyl-ACP methyl ester carboxylesterase [Jannaschia pohangensis]
MDTEPIQDAHWVLVPGTLCTGAVFDGMLDHLGVPRARRHVVRLRAPGVDDYADVLSKVPGDSVICGFSLGAIVAAHLADRLSAARLILFAVTPHPDDPARAGDRHAFARTVAASGGAAALAPGLSGLAGPDPEAARRIILDMAEVAAGDIAAQTELAMGRPGAARALSACGLPLWVLTGSDDRQTPPKVGREAAGYAPKGAFRLLDGLGHYALLEDPEACAAALLDLEGTAR